MNITIVKGPEAVYETKLLLKQQQERAKALRSKYGLKSTEGLILSNSDEPPMSIEEDD